MRRSALIAVLLLSGCPGPQPPPDDGGMPEADAPPSASGRVEIVLEAEQESLEDDVTLELFEISIGELRAPNDRGGDLEPYVDGIGAVDLTAAPRSWTLDGAVPATYGRVTMQLAPSRGAPSLELRLVESGITLHVIDDRPIAVDARCDLPAVLEPGETVALRTELPLGEIHGVLRSEELPPPVDGVIRVDPTTSPDAILALEDAIRERWELECREDEPWL